MNDGFQLVSAIAARPGNLFGADHPATLGLKPVELGLKILVSGADACVANPSHVSRHGFDGERSLSHQLDVNAEVTTRSLEHVTSHHGIP